MTFINPKSLPITALAVLAGMCATLGLPQLPSLPYIYALCAIAALLLSLRTNHIIYIVSVAALGFSYLSFNFAQLQQHNLPVALETQKVSVIGTISSVVEGHKKPNQKFIFKVQRLVDGQKSWNLPANIQLTWPNAPATLQPGDSWQLTAKLKRPRNYANPGSFDAEKYFLQQRVVALGYVVPKTAAKLIARSAWRYPINSLRQYILQYIQHSLEHSEFSNIISALAIGVKGTMPSAQVEVLQNTGTIHLMAISGLHVGIVAALMFWLVRMTWRYVPQKWLIFPAPWVAAWMALIVSIFYALVAGFSIATQRAIIMLAVFLSGIILKRKIAVWHSFSLALLLVLLWDPFAILGVGFWFSFLAVAALLYAVRGRRTWWHSQLVIAAALLPLNLLFFGQNSWIAPLANSIAIPCVSCAVLPFSLIAVFSLPFMPELSACLWKFAAQNFAYLWPLLNKLAAVPVFTWQFPEQYLPFIICAAGIGALWLFIPRGLPGRWFGIFALAPVLFAQSDVIPYGQAEFTLLDVGQGLATVVRTQQHVLVYDTGAKLNDDFDLGTRVVAPYLQNVGVKKINTLMISHGDNDHIGGARGLLHKIHVDAVLTSAPQSLNDLQPIECQAGQQWQWDGVTFTVLHPDQQIHNKKRNDHSCVLMVQAGAHKALLTGDIETRSEKQLIAHYGTDLRADLMLVPHHGSKTSSSLEFLQTVQPKYALIPVGYKNQYGHPKEPVLQRYQDLNIPVLRTEYDGAISFRLGGDLLPHCYRWEHQRFWSQ